MSTSVLLGSETPRLATPPLRELTPETSYGFECIAFAEGVLGLTLLPWQKWLLIHALEVLPDGRFRFRTCLVLIARQNGKTLLMQVIALWRMYVDGAGLVIGTAQNLDVAEEAWNGAVGMAEDVPELLAEIEHVDRTNGKKQIRLKAGPRYKVAAASRRGGRGLSGDTVMLDELREHQSWDAWNAVTNTTIARPYAQILGFSNAGDQSSVVLKSLRDKALAALNEPETSLGIFEWSAPDGCDPDDPQMWVLANPSLGHTIGPEAIRSARETAPDAGFRTENLCQWVEDMSEPVIPAHVWAKVADSESEIVGRYVLAVDVNKSRDHASIAVCGARSDGLPHVEVIASTGFLDPDGNEYAGIGWVARVLAGHPDAAIVADEWAVAGVDVGGAEVQKATASKVVQACAAFYDAATSDGLRHLDQGPLNAALRGARKRELEASWAWSRRDTSVDLTPLVAVTLALWGWQSTLNAQPAYLPPVAYR